MSSMTIDLTTEFDEMNFLLIVNSSLIVEVLEQVLAVRSRTRLIDIRNETPHFHCVSMPGLNLLRSVVICDG